MQLYFINLMTKFTFMFLSLLPLFSLKPLPSGKRAKQQHSRTKQTYREITHNNKAPGGHFRPPHWLLNTAFFYLFEIVRTISNLLSVVERDVFVPKVLSVGGSDSETYSFVPIYFFPYREITQYPESIFFLPCCRFLLPGLGN